MPSLVTSVLGGEQSASAAHNAANTAAGGANQAGTTVTNAANSANSGIANATNSAIQMGTDAGGNAQTLALNAGSAAGTGATTAAAAAGAGVNPYATTGAAASKTLGDMFAPGGSGATPQTAAQIMQNDPGYQFQLAQGQQAIARANAAAGTTGSGGQDKAMINYAEQAGQSGYQQAFNDSTTTQQNLYNNLSGLANAGQQAAEYAGTAGTQAAQYAGTAGTQAAQYAGTAGVQTNEYAGSAGMTGAAQVGANTINAGVYTGNAQQTAANDIAGGDLGAAKAYSGMLSGIGAAANSAITGGFAGGTGGSFNLGGALTGNQNYGSSNNVASGPGWTTLKFPGMG